MSPAKAYAQRAIAVALAVAASPLIGTGCQVREISIGDDVDPANALDPACPESSRGLGYGASCDNVPEGTSCFFPANKYGERDACYCGCKIEGRWTCESTRARFDKDCPRLMPADGSVCDLDVARTCAYYPDVECRCFPEEGWYCPRKGQVASCSNPPIWSGPPPPIDEKTLIKDLTDDEAAAWCAWHAQIIGSNPYEVPPTYDGWVTAWEVRPPYYPTFCTSSVFDSDVCVAKLPLDYCVSSLKAQPCEATVGELDDCVKTIDNQCFIVGHGCMPLRKRPWCRGLVVGEIVGKEVPAFLDPIRGCHIRVDDPTIQY